MTSRENLKKRKGDDLRQKATKKQKTGNADSEEFSGFPKEISNKNISVTVSLPGYVRTDAHARAGLDHLKSKVPNWMWVSAEQVVKETERASIKRKSEVIPGIVYKLVRPFLRLSLANLIWNGMTKRKSRK